MDKQCSVHTREGLMPVYLLADSQLLFWQIEPGSYFFQQQFSQYQKRIRQAVYIGAANADQVQYYQLFEAAMEVVGCSHSHFLTTSSTHQEAQALLQQADLILLAGGDVALGWQFIKALVKQLQQSFEHGAVLIGVSAGAMHLAALAWMNKDTLCASDLYATSGIAPCIVGVHDENNHWQQLAQVVGLTQGCFPALGIASGGGVAVENRTQITALRKSVARFAYQRQSVTHTTLAAGETIDMSTRAD